MRRPMNFDACFLQCPDFSRLDIPKHCEQFKNVKLSENERVAGILSLIRAIDLTTLSGDDTPERICKLVEKALSPLPCCLLKKLELSHINCAAVCFYPARIPDAINYLHNKNPTNNIKLDVASVAGGFPSGQYKLETRLQEIQLAIKDGATEIDTVINRCAALTGHWDVVHDEFVQMRNICGDKVRLKTILATGDLVSNENIYKASMVAMLAGSDFIKTSTGKETTNATLPVSYVMCSAIKTFHEKTKEKVGFKPAGGIKDTNDALSYLYLLKNILGDDWTSPNLFRIGASSLLDTLINDLSKLKP